jgi:hypothetical protein
LPQSFSSIHFKSVAPKIEFMLKAMKNRILHFIICFTMPSLGFAQFSEAYEIEGQSGPYISGYMVDVADFNGDNKEDIIVINEYGFQILLNEGDLNYSEPIDFTGYDLTHPTSFHIADVDQNGYPDILVGLNWNRATDTGSVFYRQIIPPGPPIWNQGVVKLIRNLGGMTFSNEQIITGNLGVVSDIITSDLTGNEELEIIVASTVYDYNSAVNSEGDTIITTSNYNHALGGISYFTEHSNQDSVFSTQVNLTDTFTFGSSVVLIDYDQDGDEDIVYSSQTNGHPAWIENIGNGQFDSVRTIYVDHLDVKSVYMSDVNNDGMKDLLYTASSASYSHFNLYLKPKLTDFGYGPEILLADSIYFYPEAIYLADIDYDGDEDIIYKKQDNNPGLFMLENIGNTLPAEERFLQRPLVTVSSSLAMHNSNHDNWLDVISLSGGYIYLSVSTAAENPWFKSIIPREFNVINQIYITDIDGDGRKDFLASSPSDQSLFYFRSLGNSQFDTSAHVIPYYYGLSQISPGDWDNDGDEDLVIRSTYPFRTKLVTQNADGSYSPGNLINSIYPTNLVNIKNADFNNDGNLDLLTHGGYSCCSTVIGVNINNGDGSFDDAITVFNGQEIGAYLAIADWDEDGYPDIFSIRDSSVLIIRNINGQEFDTAMVLNNQFKSGRYFNSADVDNDGDLDIVFTRGGYVNAAYYTDVLALINEPGNAYYLRPIMLNLPVYSVAEIAFRDLNNDNYTDIVLTTQSSSSSSVVSLGYSMNMGDNWDEIVPLESNLLYKLILDDINMDGLTDIFVYKPNTLKFQWYYNLFDDLTLSEKTPIVRTDAINIYPNPSNGRFTLNINAGEVPQNVQLSSIDGKSIPFNITSNNDGNSEITTNASPGIYILSLRFNSIEKKVKVLINR